MLYNLIPLVDAFLYLARFILDKLLEINESKSIPDMVLKCVLFVIEMVLITLLILLICGLIIYPVWKLSSSLLGKFWTMLHG